VQGNNAEQQARIGQAEVKLQQLAEKLLMERERFKLELQRRTEEKGESKGGGQVIVDTTGASVGGFKEMVGMIGTALSEHGNAINGMVQASGKRDELAAAVAELAAKHDELNKRLGAKRVHELV
jgi:outer membrane murein-binding lipoprotein Lpp